MNKEELIEVLRQFDEKRVEELPEKTRNIFYAIMKIADERDKYIHLYESTLKDLDIAVKNKIELENIINEAIDKLYCWGEILDAEFQQSMLAILNNLDLLENWKLEEIIEMIGIDDLEKKYASELIKDIFEVEKELAGTSYEDIC